MLDSNQTLNIIINPGRLLPAQKFSKEWTIFLPLQLQSSKQKMAGWLAGRQAEEAPTQDLEFLELS